ncbi:DUF397 domain-containing protein [Salinactinospora qingdaonensis]|uniref:DUF397 domain-containing protein n=1 Tax=Salinactinospora qingdaonensis TaxID=702744 RepID=A0ABP7FT76_9ACTN
MDKIPDQYEAPFHTSTYSSASANCVEVAHAPLSFQKASYSATESHCVEVAGWETGAAIRDTKHRDLGALAFPAAEWRAFIDAVKGHGL